MRFTSLRPAIVAGMVLVSASSALHAEDDHHPTSLERYGVGGRVHPVGLHHGFRVETVAVDSAAAEDALRANDVIVKVGGEEIRSYDQMRAVLAEAYVEGGEVAITYLRGSSLEQHTMKVHLKPVAKRKPTSYEEEKPVVKRKPVVAEEEEEKPVVKRKKPAADNGEEKPAARRKPQSYEEEKPAAIWRRNTAVDDDPR